MGRRVRTVIVVERRGESPTSAYSPFAIRHKPFRSAFRVLRCPFSLSARAPYNPPLGHHKGTRMILPKDRDPRFVTIRRGGTLSDSDHQLLAQWAALCAEHVLSFFEAAQPDDPRPRQAIAHARAWARGKIKMSEARTAAGHANAAARALDGAPRYAAYAAAQAAAVAHVAAHELGAAAYAIKAARVGAPEGDAERAGCAECQWQRDQLPYAIRELVLDDQRLRNKICWSLFTC